MLELKKRPFKPLPDRIQKFRLQFDEVEERYMMLMLWGPSRTGKSRLARSLFGEEKTLVIDVQNGAHPDLKSFDRDKHAALLLDEVASPQFVVDNKKLLQAHIDGALLGQSPTQSLAYEVWIWKVPIMLTTNNWDLSKYSAADKNWIGENVIDVYIGNPVWEEAKPQAEAAVPPPSPPRSLTSAGGRSGTARESAHPLPSPAKSTASSTGGRVWTSRRRAATEGPGPSPEHKRAASGAYEHH